MSKKKTEKGVLIPHTLEEAKKQLQELEKIQLQIDEYAKAAESRKAQVDRDVEEMIFPLRNKAFRLFEVIETFSQKNKERLTVKGKSIAINGCALQWKKRIDKLERLATDAEIIEKLEAMELHHCVNIEKSIDEKALKKLPEEKLKEIGLVRIRKGTDEFKIFIQSLALFLKRKGDELISSYSKKKKP